MSALPWAIAYGHIVWGSLLGAAVSASAWVSVRRARRDAREAALKTRDGIGPAVTRAGGLREGDTATVAGVFDAPCEYVQADGAREARPVRRIDHAPWLWVGDVGVTLRGPLRVLVGHRDGALVPGRGTRVRGVLRQVADEGAAGPYRTARSGWEMTVDDSGALRAVSEDPPRLWGFDASRIARATALTAALFVGLSGVVGEAALHAGASSVAAMVPLTREAGVAAYERALDAQAPRSERDVARRIEVAEMLRGSREGAEVALRHGRWLRAAQLAESSGAHAQAAQAWSIGAEFGRASLALRRVPAETRSASEALVDADVHLLAGDDLAAAARIEVAAESWREHRARAEALRCAADALRARHGDAAARAHLAMRAREHQPTCALLWADFLPPGDARRRVIDDSEGHGDISPLWLLLRLEDGREWSELANERVEFALTEHPEALVLMAPATIGDQVPGLEQRVLQALGGREVPTPMRALRARLSARAAIYGSAMGDRAAAERYVLRARQDLDGLWIGDPERYQDDRRRLDAIASAISLRAGLRGVRTDPSHGGTSAQWLAALASFAHSGSVHALRGAQSAEDLTHGREALQVVPPEWRAAASADGRWMVGFAREHDDSDESAPWMLFGARRMTENNDVLRQWVHHGEVFRALDGGATERAVLTANRRLLAEALDDRALVHELDGVLARATATLTRRELAVVRWVIGAR